MEGWTISSVFKEPNFDKTVLKDEVFLQTPLFGHILAPRQDMLSIKRAAIMPKPSS